MFDINPYKRGIDSVSSTRASWMNERSKEGVVSCDVGWHVEDDIIDAVHGHAVK